MPMTIEKLARFLVDDWYDGSPNGERYQIAVEDQIKDIKENMFGMGGELMYSVEVEL
jgi:hypothetical protein